jgi:hypothetical protein
MADSRIKTFSYGPDEDTTMKELEKIAKREKRSLSYVIMEAVKEYSKAHGSGNPNYTLDQIVDGVQPFPTAWSETWSKDILDAQSENDIAEMRVLLKAKLNQLENYTGKKNPPFKRPRARCPTCKSEILNPYNDFEKTILERHYSNNPGCRPKDFRPSDEPGRLEGANPMSGEAAD